MRISDWSSDVFSSDLQRVHLPHPARARPDHRRQGIVPCLLFDHCHVSRSLLVVPHAGSIGVAPTLPLPIPHSSPSGLTRGSRAGDEAVALDARVKPELSRLRYSMPLTEIGRASCRERVCQYV